MNAPNPQFSANTTHKVPPKTTAGFSIGNWGFPSSQYLGFIAGVQFYTDAALSEDAIGRAMRATKPPRPAPAKLFEVNQPVRVGNVAADLDLHLGGSP